MHELMGGWRSFFQGRKRKAAASGTAAVLGGGMILAAASFNINIGNPTTDCGGTASSVTVDSITWTFQESECVGQFANGEYWVQGPVTITDINPDAASGDNGWQVNPPLIDDKLLTGSSCLGADGCGEQSLDSQGDNYYAAEMPALPYTANGGESIVKADSTVPPPAGCPGDTCLDVAAVLTVLEDVPTDNGATVFRPPYMGTAKPLYSTDDMDAQYAGLPELTSTAEIDEDLPTLAQAHDAIGRPNISTHVQELSMFQAVINVGLDGVDSTPYGPQIGNVQVESILRALIVKGGDDEDERRQVMIDAVQRGIDVQGALEMNMNWYAAGAVNHSYMLPAVIAAFMLDNAGMKAAINDDPDADGPFQEQADIYPGRNGNPVWGQNRGDETSYWAELNDAGSNGTMYDPYGYVDGGDLQAEQTYQWCCTTAHLKGNAMIVHLMGMETVWSDDKSLDYVERWVTAGHHTQPDPCAPIAQGGGPGTGDECVLDPDLEPGSTFTSFTCQAGQQCGRMPSRHGTDVDAAATSSVLVNDAWAEYRSLW
jgi:hypothetical protein